MRNYSRFVLTLLFGLTFLPALRGESRPPALDKRIPETVEDLRIIQERVKKAAAKVMPCTVAIRIGSSAGSGVIVSKDGYVLTAGHVSDEPDRNVTVILPNGQKLKGKTLGSNSAIDSGMIRITDEGEWPYAEMGDATKLKDGAWCLALGHPEGFRRGRSPVVRLGRVLSRSDKILRTDCALVGGDSGGPLVDLDGKVIGINIARAGRTETLAIPAEAVKPLLDDLKSGKLAPPK